MPVAEAKLDRFTICWQRSSSNSILSDFNTCHPFSSTQTVRSQKTSEVAFLPAHWSERASISAITNAVGIYSSWRTTPNPLSCPWSSPYIHACKPSSPIPSHPSPVTAACATCQIANLTGVIRPSLILPQLNAQFIQSGLCHAKVRLCLYCACPVSRLFSFVVSCI